MGEITTAPAGPPPKRLFWFSLLASLFIGVCIIIGVATFIYGQIAGEAERTRQTSIVYITDISKKVAWRRWGSTDEKDSKPQSLFPEKMDVAPSPFRYQEQWRFKDSYTEHSYFSANDGNRTLDLIVGYSQPQMNGGGNGDLYLNLLGWLRTPVLSTYNYRYISRTDRDHLWLVYYSPNGELFRILLSLEGANSTTAEPFKVADIAGFVTAPSGDLTTESTVKGTVYYDSALEQYGFSVRVRVKSPKGTQRPDIDTSRLVGIEFIQEAKINNEREKYLISTFKLDNGVLVDVPHESGGTLKASLAEMHDDILDITIALRSKNSSKTLLKRESRREYESSAGLIEKGLWWLVKNILESGSPTKSSLELSRLDNEKILIVTTSIISGIKDTGDSALRVTTLPPVALVQMIKQDSQLLFWTVIALFVFFLLSILHLRVLRKVGLLTQEIASASPENIPIFSQSGEQNEVGFLSKYVQLVLENMREQHAEVSRKNRDLTTAHEKIERTHKDIVRAVRIIGHDIKNPVSILRDIHEKADNKEAEKQLRRIGLAGAAVVMIEEQFQWSFPCCPVDMSSFLHMYCKGIPNQAPNLTPEYLPDYEKITVDTNEEQLEAILDAIIENANDFGTRVKFSLIDIGERVHLYVENNGDPIADEDIPKIFEYNFSTRPEGDYTGLGLFGAKERASNIGAFISVENKGLGVRFTIDIPKQGRS